MSECVKCKNYRYNFFSSEVDGEVEWLECLARPSVANLWQFPFRNTNCKDFRSPKDTPND